MLFSGIEDYNAISIYTEAISPVTTGIEGRINFKNINNEKSRASNINPQSSQLLIILLSTFMFFKLQHFIKIN